MSGLNPRLLIAGDFIMLRMALVDTLDGDIEAALVLQRIAWRCERDGFWKASHEDIQQETRLSERKVKGALKVLRDRGFLAGKRAGAYDATLVWSVLLDTDETSVSEVDETSVSPSSKTGDMGAALPPLPTMEGRTETFASQAAVKPARAKGKATAMPKDFQPTPAMVAWTKEHCPDIDAKREWTSFVNHHEAKGSRFVKWDAAWRTWANNAQKWAEQRSKTEQKKGGNQRDMSALWIRQDFGNPLEGIN
jgi:hypothetical protein